jgi:5-methylcytosine-specific restriction protein A
MMPPRRCATCGQLVTGRCLTCARHVDLHRGSAASRGYGARWAHYRRWFLAQYPLCGDRAPGAPETADSRCRLEGRVTPADVVDHIVPVTGQADPTFFVPEAHQALCGPCHQAKTKREARTTPAGGW